MIHLICPNPAIDRTLLVRNFKEASPNRPYDVREFAGGKGFNVAYAIGFEEPKVDFCVHTILGGRNGILLKNLAKQNNTDLIATQIDANTRVCTIVMDTEKRKTYPIYENSFELDAKLLQIFNNKVLESVQKEDVVVFSGSLMKGMPTDYIANFIRLVEKKEIRCFVDTSGEALIEAYKAKPYAIKINDEEIVDLFPNTKLETIQDYVNLLVSKQIAAIPIFIITLGEKGIIAKMNNEIIHIKAPSFHAKNPIACGDFFLGALVKNWVLNKKTITTLKKAISYSTANVLHWFPELSEQDIKKIYAELEVKQYK
ncbi:1-phosphofructokinase family hexose kinase [Enterococcus sp. LJL99]